MDNVLPTSVGINPEHMVLKVVDVNWSVGVQTWTLWRPCCMKCGQACSPADRSQWVHGSSLAAGHGHWRYILLYWQHAWPWTTQKAPEWKLQFAHTQPYDQSAFQGFRCPDYFSKTLGLGWDGPLYHRISGMHFRVHFCKGSWNNPYLIHIFMNGLKPYVWPRQKNQWIEGDSTLFFSHR